MAEAYRDAYLRQGVQDGEKFVDVWKFADDGVYASPYFTGDQVFQFSEFPEESAAGLHHGGQGVLADASRTGSRPTSSTGRPTTAS